MDKNNIMKNKKSAINIALVGGEDLCIELLEKTTFDYHVDDIDARIVAVADCDRKKPGMVLAEKLGVRTVTDYNELYSLKCNIDLIIILVPDNRLFNDILNKRPPYIRILSYHVFKLFWKAIGIEERKLKERNREVETILNGIRDFILVITPDKKIIHANQVFLEKMDFTLENIAGKKCCDVFKKGNPPCMEKDSACPLNEVILNKKPITRTLRRMNHKGEERYFEVTVFPVWEKQGKISEFIEISRDVTDRKKQEEEFTKRLEKMVKERTVELEETHTKLLHQDKMASLGKLSASVVHEINNPITGILNLILLIKRITEEDSISGNQINQFNRYLDLMETETRRISRIVSNLLTFSRQTRMELRPVNINMLIEKTLFLNSNLLKINNITIEKIFVPDLPDAVGSEDQLQQVFMNIISNSAEAMDSVTNKRVLTVETKSCANSISIEFKDTGAGIPESNVSNLFEPFFTTKKKGKGVGLGLSVAYGIIQKHNGSIHVKSKKGKRTVFTVDLPVNDV